MKTELWFELAMRDNGNDETMSIFSSSLLSECIKEMCEQKYSKEDYFIDIWEMENDGTPVSVGELDMTKIFIKG